MNTEIEKKINISPTQLNAWEEEYLSDDWSQMHLSEIKRGRPRISAEDLHAISIKLTTSDLEKIEELKKIRGINRSEFIRNAVKKELATITT